MIRTGFYFAIPPSLAGGLSLWFGWWVAAVIAICLAVFTLFFFRDPERLVPDEPGVVVSPADGRVLSIDPVRADDGEKSRISIFLSLFDVHVNRAPIGGQIEAVRYQPGRFHLASRDKASAENELNEVALLGEGTRIVFRQIAGLVARRIEFWHKPGDVLERGQRVGMIRFGSRVEVFLDQGYRVQVKPGDHVKGGSSILAARE